LAGFSVILRRNGQEKTVAGLSGELFALLGFSSAAGRFCTARTTITTGNIGVLAGSHFPLTIKSSSGKKGTDADDRPNNNCFYHDTCDSC
jgi:hypothetical protein